jgi:hypothetical protein
MGWVELACSGAVWVMKAFAAKKMTHAIWSRALDVYSFLSSSAYIGSFFLSD